MSYIEEWSKDKPKLLAMFAIQLAFNAESCFECAEQIKKQEGLADKLPVPPLNEWLSLYKNHHRIFGSIRNSQQNNIENLLHNS